MRTEEGFANLPVSPLAGGAGSGGPLNRETRFKEHSENIRQNTEEMSIG